MRKFVRRTERIFGRHVLFIGRRLLPPAFVVRKNGPGYAATPQGAHPGPHLFWDLIMRKTVMATALLAMLVLTACNTVRGVGRDVESVGKTVQKTTN